MGESDEGQGIYKKKLEQSMEEAKGIGKDGVREGEKEEKGERGG